MNVRVRTIEIDETTAETLEARAAERGITVAKLVAGLVALDAQVWPEELEAMRAGGEGHWSQEALAEDEHAFEEFERTGVGIPMAEMLAWLRSLESASSFSVTRERIRQVEAKALAQAEASKRVAQTSFVPGQLISPFVPRTREPRRQRLDSRLRGK